jgi:acyl carrier protein phosphodiesterase
MNFLAHLYLSHGNIDLMVGNLAADAVKGSDLSGHSRGVQNGILLHRAIDAYTDSHQDVRAMIALMRPAVGRYAGPVVDILCDHLLAKNWAKSHNIPLEIWSKNVYAQLLTRVDDLPESMRDRIKSMIEHDWLMGYDGRAELEYVMSRFSRRLLIPLDVAQVSRAFFEEHYDQLDRHFIDFFPEIHLFTLDFLHEKEIYI